MISAFSLVLALAGTAAAPAGPPNGPTVGSSMEEGPTTLSGAAPMLAAASIVQGLPPRAPEPRTLHEFWPFFALFALTWIGITAYLLSFGARMRRLADAMATDATRGAGR